MLASPILLLVESFCRGEAVAAEGVKLVTIFGAKNWCAHRYVRCDQKSCFVCILLLAAFVNCNLHGINLSAKWSVSGLELHFIWAVASDLEYIKSSWPDTWWRLKNKKSVFTILLQEKGFLIQRMTYLSYIDGNLRGYNWSWHQNTWCCICHKEFISHLLEIIFKTGSAVFTFRLWQYWHVCVGWLSAVGW